MMKGIERFIGATLKYCLIIFGLDTCLPIVVAYNVDLGSRLLFFGLLDYLPPSVPVLRHWGIMVCGIGVLMIVAAFRPWLRFETMVFSTVEKSFLVFLVITSMGEPWGRAYAVAGAMDATIVVYSVLYFISSYGRPQRWVPTAPTRRWAESPKGK